jgi:hypothetical protein
MRICMPDEWSTVLLAVQECSGAWRSVQARNADQELQRVIGERRAALQPPDGGRKYGIFPMYQLLASGAYAWYCVDDDELMNRWAYLLTLERIAQVEKLATTARAHPELVELATVLVGGWPGSVDELFECARACVA